MKLYSLFLLSIILLITSCSTSRRSECGYNANKLEFNADDESIGSKNMADFPETIVIPVVFHVAYKNESQKIPLTLLQQELQELNDNFQGKNDQSTLPEQFQNLVGSANVEFKLATFDEEGKETDGVIYFYTKRRRYTFNRPIFWDDPIWNPQKYMNVYIGNIRGGKTKGYVNSYPWQSKKSDAIALHHTYLGQSNELLTHEVGHWFGLWHITEGGCSEKNDGVADTPKQKEFSKKCPVDKFECGNECLVMNYMDYSNCRNMFTLGQIERMKAIILTHRLELLKSTHPEEVND